MSLKQRFGTFLILAGVIFLFIFAASTMPATEEYNLGALLLGGITFVLGWHWRFAKSKAKAGPPPAAAPPPVPKTASPKVASPKKRGLMTTFLKGPSPKKTAPPPPAAPPPPPKKKGLAAVFKKK